jgi:hypothetical protein
LQWLSDKSPQKLDWLTKNAAVILWFPLLPHILQCKLLLSIISM